MNRLNERQKRVIIGTLAFAVGFLITRLFKEKPTIDIYIQALFPALAAGLTAAALVLIYKTIRIINWAQIGLGIVAAQLFYELYTQGILPFGLALGLALLAGPLVGGLVGAIFSTLFFRHPRLVLTVGTILIVGLIGYIQTQLDGVFHPEGTTRTYPPLIGPFPETSVTIGVTPFRFLHLIALFLLVATSIGLVIFFRKTRVGMAVRASAENADRASLLGINVKLLQVGVWTLTGAISAVALVGAMPIENYNSEAGQDFLILLLPLAAAVVARMTSMPVAFFAGVGLGAFRYLINFSLQDPSMIDIGLFAVIMVGLLVQRRKIQVRGDDSTSWKAVKEIRPTPRELLALPVIRRTRRVMILLAAAATLAFPWLFGVGTVSKFGRIWPFAIILISLVILTGWSGQISLGQFALVAIGAFLAGNLSSRIGVPFWFAVPIAGLGGALLAVIIGLPALRIRGLFLAVTTFAIASVQAMLIFNEDFLGKWVPVRQVDRPELFGLVDFQDYRSMYYLMLLSFVAVVAAITALRKSRAGRVLIALRDNEQGAQSFGINIVRTRLTAFAISGFIAAMAGGLLVHYDLGMSRDTYSAFASLEMFIVVVIGGVSSVSGAVLGALYLMISQNVLSAGVAALTQGILGIAMLIFIPGGLTQIVYGARDAILRVVAMRQHIVVPSLFADYSPEAWEKRLAPLSPALQTQGLAALKPEQRYALTSKVFEGASA